MVTGPQPLALQAGRLARGLPDRLVPLDELTVLLLHPSVSTAARNKVLAELVRRSGSPAWTVGLTGVALPGLTRAVASLAAAYRGVPGDLEAEVLAGFLAALRALDPDELDRIPLASRLTWAAYRAGRALAYSDAAWAARRRDLDESCRPPARPSGHPDFVLAAAVRRGVITAADAQLIGASRLEGIPLSRLAAETGSRHDSLCRRRAKAEKMRTGQRPDAALDGSRQQSPARPNAVSPRLRRHGHCGPVVGVCRSGGDGWDDAVHVQGPDYPQSQGA